MARYFNAIVEFSKKRGGIAKLEPYALLFRDSISYLNIIDIQPSNGHFTWNNRIICESCVAERLDQFLVSYYWVGDLWSTRSKIIDWRGSDHWPIKLNIIFA